MEQIFLSQRNPVRSKYFLTLHGTEETQCPLLKKFVF